MMVFFVEFLRTRSICFRILVLLFSRSPFINGGTSRNRFSLFISFLVPALVDFIFVLAVFNGRLSSKSIALKLPYLNFN